MASLILIKTRMDKVGPGPGRLNGHCEICAQRTQGIWGDRDEAETPSVQVICVCVHDLQIFFVVIYLAERRKWCLHLHLIFSGLPSEGCWKLTQMALLGWQE